MIGILSLFILVVLLGGLIFGVVLWITGGRSGSGNEMACGGCGYAVRGLEALNCPECGADLRLVGISRGQGGGSRVFGMVLTFVCGGVLLFGCLGSMFLFVGSPSPQSIQSVPLQSMPSSSQSTTTATSPPILIEEESARDAEDEQSSEEDLPGSDQPTP